MAEGLENLIVVTSLHREDSMSCYMIPQTEWDHVARFMAKPNHYTTLFSLSKAAVVEGYNKLGPRVFSLTRVAARSPFIHLDHLQTFYRTKWLGKAPETINEEMEEVIRALREVAEQSAAPKFPLPTKL